MAKHFLEAIPILLLLSFPAFAADWTVPGNFPTIQAAIDSPDVSAGDRIIVAGPGDFAGAYVTKNVEIKGTGGAVISTGPAHTSGLIMGFLLLAGSDGATISHLTFKVDQAIMNGAAVDGVTITQCTFLNSIQAVSNWRGNSWEISQNEIINLRTRCGGGIGILIGDYTGGEVSGNVVSHNKIYGTLFVSSGDCGEYNGSGIVLYADFRWGSLGAHAITLNQIVKNTISMTSDTPDLVDIVAFEMTDSRDDTSVASVIFSNAIGFNDFRGTALEIVLTPENLSDVNSISRNLSKNTKGRGKGLHPSVFGPGGN
jgi:hypothetical protein